MDVTEPGLDVSLGDIVTLPDWLGRRRIGRIVAMFEPVEGPVKVTVETPNGRLHSAPADRVTVVRTKETNRMLLMAGGEG